MLYLVAVLFFISLARGNPFNHYPQNDQFPQQDTYFQQSPPFAQSDHHPFVQSDSIIVPQEFPMVRPPIEALITAPYTRRIMIIPTQVQPISPMQMLSPTATIIEAPTYEPRMKFGGQPIISDSLLTTSIGQPIIAQQGYVEPLLGQPLIESAYLSGPQVATINPQIYNSLMGQPLVGQPLMGQQMYGSTVLTSPMMGQSLVRSPIVMLDENEEEQ